MKADDKRHGTTAGYQAHRRAGVPVCGDCLRAKTRYEKSRNVYGEQMVPAIGTRRRIRALKALGFSGSEIGDHLRITYQAVHKLETSKAAKVYAPTSRSVAALYEQLSLARPIGPHSQRIRNHAARLGYALPWQWFDIDDPAEIPDPGYSERRSIGDEADPVVVDRILGGDMSLAKTATRAEKVEVVARWTGSKKQLETRTGWNTNRYREDVSA